MAHIAAHFLLHPISNYTHNTQLPAHRPQQTRAGPALPPPRQGRLYPRFGHSGIQQPQQLSCADRARRGPGACLDCIYTQTQESDTGGLYALMLIPYLLHTSPSPNTHTDLHHATAVARQPPRHHAGARGGTAGARGRVRAASRLSDQGRGSREGKRRMDGWMELDRSCGLSFGWPFAPLFPECNG